LLSYSDDIVLKIASIFAAAIALEASVEGKPTTVSGSSGLKGLSLEKFILTSTLLTPTYINLINDAVTGKPLRMGRYVLSTISEIVDFKLISTNTALGYLILSIPLAYSVGYLIKDNEVFKPKELPITVVRIYSLRVKKHLSSESSSDLCKALIMVRPSYLGKVYGKIPDINLCVGNGDTSLIDLIGSSRYLDIIMYELYHDYPRTTELSKYLLNTLGNSPLQKVLLDAFLRLSSNVIDSVVLRSRGYSYALIIKYLMRYFNHGLISPKYSSWLRSKCINLGSVADILACSLALALTSIELGE